MQMSETINMTSIAAGPSSPIVNTRESESVAQDLSKNPPRSKLAIEAHGICKSYRIGGESRQVLDHINFSAAIGECVFLSGPSGSGKSTLLSILGCLLEPDEGRLAISGRRVDRLSVSQRTLVRRSRIGFVFQRFQLINGISAQDNVAVPLTLQGIPLGEARDLAGQLLVHVGLGLHRDALPTRMSPGQCQRVALARAVIARPKLVLADEPTAALDGKSGAEVMELLKQLVHSAGASAVVVTHDPRIHHYADRVCEIENGVLR
jgi:putative ABC transport system ATP-binding protein